jgi:hypothetical protein
LFLVGPTALLIEYWFELRSRKSLSAARATA